MQSSPSANQMSLKTLIAAAVTFLAMAVAHGLVKEARAQEDAISVELNKLEPVEKGCQVYFMISNTSNTPYDTFQLDLLMFKKDGIIERRFALDLAPMRPSKRFVRVFVLNDTKCEDIGSFLVNDVVKCRTEDQADQDCLARLKVSSLTNVDISK